MKATLFIILGLCIPYGAQAQGVYRWTDAQGGVHYGDAPPAGAKAAAVEADITVLPAPPPPSPAVLEANRKAQEARKLSELQAQLEEERAARKQAERKVAIREACQVQHGVPCNDEGLPLEQPSSTVTYGLWYPLTTHRPPHRPPPGARPPTHRGSTTRPDNPRKTGTSASRRP